jgi:hypothetical protein
MNTKFSTPCFVLTMFGLAIFAPIFGQPPEIEWDRTYGGDSSDAAYSVCSTSDGGYIIVGDTRSYSAETDIYLVKTDGMGDVDWFRVIGGADYDDARSIKQTTDGGYIIAGTSSSFCNEYTDMYLVKTDSNGDTTWTRTYGGSDLDYAESVVQTLDGGYVLAGCTRLFSGAFFEMYLVKTDSMGNTSWSETYAGADDRKAYSVQQTRDGGYIIAGYNPFYGGIEYDIYLLKTNNQGDTLWSRIYGGSDIDRAFAVQQTIDGGYIIAGSTTSFGAGYEDVYIVKTDSLGDTLWTHTYGGTDGERANSIQQTANGSYIVAGITSSYGSGEGDLYLIKIDGVGDTLWTMVYGSPDNEGGSSIDQTIGGGYIVAGSVTTFVPPYSFLSDCWLVKTGPDTAVSGAPVIQWVSHPKNFTLHPAYPNPFNPVTMISYEVPVRGIVRVDIYNVLGKKTAELVHGIACAGRHSVMWNASDLPSGLYFVRLEAGEFHQTRKVVLLK